MARNTARRVVEMIYEPWQGLLRLGEDGFYEGSFEAAEHGLALTTLI